MILRQAVPDDLDTVMEIENASFISSIREKREVFAERINVCGSCFIIFEDEAGKQPAGYFSAERWKEVPSDYSSFALNHSAGSMTVPDGPVIYLSSFALLPSYRGKGEGKKLFADAIGWFSRHNPGLTDAVLLVNEAWHGAAHIYASDGFHETQRLHSFFPSEAGTYTDGIIMTKKL